MLIVEKKPMESEDDEIEGEKKYLKEQELDEMKPDTPSLFENTL